MPRIMRKSSLPNDFITTSRVYTLKTQKIHARMWNVRLTPSSHGRLFVAIYSDDGFGLFDMISGNLYGASFHAREAFSIGEVVFVQVVDIMG